MSRIDWSKDRMRERTRDASAYPSSPSSKISSSRRHAERHTVNRLRAERIALKYPHDPFCREVVELIGAGRSVLDWHVAELHQIDREQSGAAA